MPLFMSEAVRNMRWTSLVRPAADFSRRNKFGQRQRSKIIVVTLPFSALMLNTSFSSIVMRLRGQEVGVQYS
jgi:hypothetical protein